MVEKYKQIAIDKNFNTYFLCVGDKDYNIEKEIVVPANQNCNCYSVAKAFTVFAIGLLYDKGLVKPTDLITDILKKYLPLDIDEKWFKVTIHDVLLHKVGFGCGLLDIDSDDASLYPTTMRQFNISPDTLLFKDKNHVPKENEIKCTNGCVYTNEFEGFIPKILSDYFAKRKEYKKLMVAAQKEKYHLIDILKHRENKVNDHIG
jgi:hypothetical protein